MPGDELPRQRALILKAMGPAIFTMGLVWAVARLTLTDPSLTIRALAFAPPHQMMLVGLVIALVCVPLAAEVERASPEQLAMVQPEAPAPPQGRRERRRRSYHGYN